MMLTEDEIPEDVIEDSKIFHFGTLSMTHTGARAATKKQSVLQKRQEFLFPLIKIYFEDC